ncbi:MAG: hypothetical protein ABIF12_02345 [bacterium]
MIKKQPIKLIILIFIINIINPNLSSMNKQSPIAKLILEISKPFPRKNQRIPLDQMNDKLFYLLNKIEKLLENANDLEKLTNDFLEITIEINSWGECLNLTNRFVDIDCRDTTQRDENISYGLGIAKQQIPYSVVKIKEYIEYLTTLNIDKLKNEYFTLNKKLNPEYDRDNLENKMPLIFISKEGIISKNIPLKLQIKRDKNQIYKKIVNCFFINFLAFIAKATELKLDININPNDEEQINSLNSKFIKLSKKLFPKNPTLLDNLDITTLKEKFEIIITTIATLNIFSEQMRSWIHLNRIIRSLNETNTIELKVDLSYMNLNNEQLKYFLKKLSPESKNKITHLNLSNNELTQVDVRKLKNLKIIDIRLNRIKKTKTPRSIRTQLADPQKKN